MNGYELRAIPAASPARVSVTRGKEYEYAIYRGDAWVFRADRHGLMFLAETVRNLRHNEALEAAA